MAEDTHKRTGYRKLSGRGRSLMSIERLWQGPDHLLMVKEVGCSEEYKRFYFKDIQAITIAWSRSYALWFFLLPLIAIMVSGMFWSAGGVNVLWFTALPFVLIWVIHLMRGPTCKCWIHTGINKVHLNMFPRVSQAKRFWQRIEPILTEAQGGFSLEEMEVEGTFVDRRMRPAPPELPPPSMETEG